jgi:hypothetical protein
MDTGVVTGSKYAFLPSFGERLQSDRSALPNNAAIQQFK